ncbi:MAG: hypothetical protein C5B50_27300 [Verrucomicrobia bacterium]|nr:MAG: hypothetical protein C5B50_27300 [Verrucomicrobiota bacterium]
MPLPSSFLRIALSDTLRAMHATRRAVIDVGTNSIKLLVADVAGREVQPVLEQSRQTRLGKDFYQTHRLQSARIEESAKAVAEFAEMAHQQGCARIRVIATSAAREAVNGGDLTAAIKKVSGLDAEIISGEQEAEWAFQGATTDPGLATQTLMLLDVGGGSTQLIIGHGPEILFRRSLRLGSVRLIETMPPSDPPTTRELTGYRKWLSEFLQREVEDRGPRVGGSNIQHPVSSIQHPSTRITHLPRRLAAAKQCEGGSPAEADHASLLVGTGGTASILGCMEGGLDKFDRARLEATRLSLGRVRWHVERLWSVPLEERKQIVGLPPNRADVILAGSAIYEAAMEQFGFEELRISTRGLRFAAIL